MIVLNKKDLNLWFAYIYMASASINLLIYVVNCENFAFFHKKVVQTVEKENGFARQSHTPDCGGHRVII